MTVHAPFNFVTLSNFVYFPKWGDKISHDVPFEDGICGEFDITITAHSKLLIGGKRGKHPKDGIQTVEPFQLPKGPYAIPESTLRGMIRNVLEIAAFGQMKLVDDKRYGIRDLTDAALPYYRKRIINKVRAGWLWFDGRDQASHWKITPCEFARVSFTELDVIRGRKDIDWRKRENAENRYKDWGANKTTVALKVEGIHAVSPRHGEDAEQGTLVFTGNSGIKKPAKKAEFFFYDVKGDNYALPVERDVFAAFSAIHDPDDGRPVNPTWRYWKQRWSKDSKVRIPVFFIQDDADRVETFGLAMMFKLAHEKSVKELIRNSSSKHTAEDTIDLATAIFGQAADESAAKDSPKSQNGLKTRVHLGLAKCINETGPLEEPVTILAGPKPSYFPAYIRQPVKQNSGKLDGSEHTYATYTPVLDSHEPELRCPEIRGWKRYPVGRSASVADARRNPNEKVKVYLRPLRRGAVFISRVRFHNLRPVELGALLWALEWGGKQDLRHKLGMGKPYGYGEISIRVDEASWVTEGQTPSIRPNNGQGEQARPASHYIQCFVAEMERAYQEAARNSSRSDCSWSGSEQIQQLLAMADTVVGASKNAEKHTHTTRGPDGGDIEHGCFDYMLLDLRVTNEFVEAKKNYEVLPFYFSSSPEKPPLKDHDIWQRNIPPRENAFASTSSAQANDASFHAGGYAIYTEWEERVKILAIRGDKADIESEDGDERVSEIPLTHLKKLPNRR